jgi:hypothetical protein
VATLPVEIQRSKDVLERDKYIPAFAAVLKELSDLLMQSVASEHE